jgi:hypothetical protein
MLLLVFVPSVLQRRRVLGERSLERNSKRRLGLQVLQFSAKLLRGHVRRLTGAILIRELNQLNEDSPLRDDLILEGDEAIRTALIALRRE